MSGCFEEWIVDGRGVYGAVPQDNKCDIGVGAVEFGDGLKAGGVVIADIRAECAMNSEVSLGGSSKILNRLTMSDRPFQILWMRS